LRKEANSVSFHYLIKEERLILRLNRGGGVDYEQITNICVRVGLILVSIVLRIYFKKI